MKKDKIIQIENKPYYAQIPNQIIRDGKISNGAFRVYCYIKSQNNNFKISQRNISKQLNCSIVSIEKYILELKNKGYLDIKEIDNTTYKYILLDNPNNTISHIQNILQNNNNFIDLLDQMTIWANDKNIPKEIREQIAKKKDAIIHCKWL